jgi:cytochrome b6-f complex iron-sulfur subunit
LDRRGFLRYVLSILGLTALGSFLYPLFRYFAPPQAETAAQTVVVQKDLIPEGSAKEIILGSAPVIILNVPGTGYRAVSRVCTHLGCLVQYDKEGKKLLCPCHAGVFDLDGNVVSGPPPRALETVPLKVEGEKLLLG